MENDAGRLFAGFTAQYSRASNGIKSFFGNGNLGVNGYSIGVGGSVSWKDDRYALYGELLAKTSLANPGHSYGYQGTRSGQG
ncbi:hypothetical protein [Cupriavidus campinensis]